MPWFRPRFRWHIGGLMRSASDSVAALVPSGASLAPGHSFEGLKAEPTCCIKDFTRSFASCEMLFQTSAAKLHRPGRHTT